MRAWCIQRLLLGAILVCVAQAGYVLQLELQSFSNPGHTLANGTCCEKASTAPQGRCSGQCDVTFIFCWKSYQSGSLSIGENACFSRGSTAVYGDGDSITFPRGELLSKPNSVAMENPLTFRGDVWPGGLQLFVRAMHIYSGSNRALIDHFRLQESISPGADISFRNYTGIKHNANIVARFSLTCTKGYYQPNCSTYCAPQNSDNMGHYMCDESTGEKICLHGYTNPARNCTVCVPASGCLNGYCTRPNECICHSGYEGQLCHQDLDVCGHTNPCLKGTCTNTGPNNYACNCPMNYFGPRCEHYYEDNVSCSDSLCQNGGTCISNNNNSYTCVCGQGYDGTNCADDLDVCGHHTPCNNNAMCINTGPNTYHCLCTTEHNGSFNCDHSVAMTSVVQASNTGPSESSTAEPTVSKSHKPVPALPVLVGSVVGCLVLLTVLGFIICVIRRECLASRRKQRHVPDTAHVYTTVRASRSLSSSNQHSSNSHDSTDTSTEVQQEFTNPLYSETDYYSSIVDLPQRRDSSVQLSSSHYSNTVELSHSNLDYQSINQGRTKDEKSIEREHSPYYAVIPDRHASFHGTPTPLAPNIPPRHSIQSVSYSLPAPEEPYCDPVDALTAAKQAHLYQMLENGSSESGSADIKGGSLPPLYMVLEEPSGRIKVSVNSEYAEATELSRHPPPKKSNIAPVLPNNEGHDP